MQLPESAGASHRSGDSGDEEPRTKKRKPTDEDGLIPANVLD